MEKRSNIYIIIIIVLIAVIGVYSLYKMNKRHEEKLYNVLKNNIEYNAKKCFLETECSNEFTLNDLYIKGYLKTLYDPISKEELDSNIKITIKEDKVYFKI